VTISLGIANYPVDATSPDDLLRCADRAMYIAKARGKNQVQLYGANRRAHRRINAVIDGEYRLFEKEAHHFSTLDLSERSLRISVDRMVPEGTTLDFTLMLPEHGQRVRALGRVLRTEEGDDGHHRMVLTIVDISPRAHLTLKQYLRERAEE